MLHNTICSMYLIYTIYTYTLISKYVPNKISSWCINSKLIRDEMKAKVWEHQIN